MQRCHICNPCTIPGAHNSLRHLLVSQALYLTLFLKHLKVQRIIQSLSKLIRSFFFFFAWTEIWKIHKIRGNLYEVSAPPRFCQSWGIQRSTSVAVLRLQMCQSQQNAEMCKNAEIKHGGKNINLMFSNLSEGLAGAGLAQLWVGCSICWTQTLFMAARAVVGPLSSSTACSPAREQQEIAWSLSKSPDQT